MAEKVDGNPVCPDSNGSKETTVCSREEIQNCIPIQRYIEELKFENDSWKNLYQEVKKNYEETFQKLKLNPLKLEWDCCADLLTEEEKVFLSDKPDYRRIRRDIKLLLESEPHCKDSMMETAVVMDRITSVANLQKDLVKSHINKHSQS